MIILRGSGYGSVRTPNCFVNHTAAWSWSGTHMGLLRASMFPWEWYAHPHPSDIFRKLLALFSF